MATLRPGQPWAAVFFWLCLTGFVAYFWPPPFWVLPTLIALPFLVLSLARFAPKTIKHARLDSASKGGR